MGRSTDPESSPGGYGEYRGAHPSFRQGQDAGPSVGSAYAQAAHAHDELGTGFPDEEPEPQYEAAPSSHEVELVAAAITSARVESPLRSYGRAMPTTVVGLADDLVSALAALAELQSLDDLDTATVAPVPAPDVEPVPKQVSLHPFEPSP